MTSQKQAVPPHNIDAEMALLGSVLVTRDLFDVVKAKVAWDDFYAHTHGTIFQAMTAVVEANLPLDKITLSEELRTRGVLEHVGGISYLSTLMDTVQTAASADYYATIVSEKAGLRRLIDEGKALMRAAYEGEVEGPVPVAALAISRVESIVQRSAQRAPVSAQQAVLQTGEFLAGEGISLIPTQWPAFNRRIGGFARKEMNIWGANPGMGKCQKLGTPVVMFDGTIRKCEDVLVGDLLMGPDSRPRRVLSTARGTGKLFRVVPTKGDPYVVNDAHILSVRANRNQGALTKGQVLDINVESFASASPTFRHICKGFRTAVDFVERTVPVDPYALGAWLGDGTASRVEITSADKEVVEYWRKYGASLGLKCHVSSKRGDCASYHLSDGPSNGGSRNVLLNAMRYIGVIGNKHIPQVYLSNSRAQRLALLAGIIDTDGYLVSGCYELAVKSERLANDVLFLCRSLGFAANMKLVRKGIKSTGFVGEYWRVFISGDLDLIPVLVPRRKAPPRKQRKDVTSVGLTIEDAGFGEYAGFSLDGDHRYLLGDFTVTHNSGAVMSLGHHRAQEVGPVGMFCLEMGVRPTMMRFAAMLSGISITKLRTGDFDKHDYRNIIDALDHNFYDLPFTLFDKRPAWSVADIGIACRKLRREQGDLVSVIIDHIGFLTDVARGDGNESKHHRLDTAFKQLLELADELDCEMHLVQHMNRAAKDGVPTMFDLRDGGNPEGNAHNIIIPWRPNPNDDDAQERSKGAFILDKARDGESGMAKMRFWGARSMWVDEERMEPWWTPFDAAAPPQARLTESRQLGGDTTDDDTIPF